MYYTCCLVWYRRVIDLEKNRRCASLLTRMPLHYPLDRLSGATKHENFLTKQSNSPSDLHRRLDLIPGLLPILAPPLVPVLLVALCSAPCRWLLSTSKTKRNEQAWVSGLKCGCLRTCHPCNPRKFAETFIQYSCSNAVNDLMISSEK